MRSYQLDLVSDGQAALAGGLPRAVVVPAAGDGITAPSPIPAIEIDFPGDARVRIPMSPGFGDRGGCGLARR
jgi:hypothetical protein